MIIIDWNDGTGRRDYAEDKAEALLLVKDEHPNSTTKEDTGEVTNVYRDDEETTPVAFVYEA
jgi:hypothetical protein